MHKGIELAITDDGKLAIRCLAHNQVHTENKPFCCVDVMVRSIAMAIERAPQGYRARMNPKDLTGTLFEIVTTPLLAFNPIEKGVSPIE